MSVDLSVFEFVDANVQTLEIDKIRRMLEPQMIGYHMQSPIFDPGTSVYRARKIGPAFAKADGITKGKLIYPPREKAQLGRLNRPGAPIFYSSIHKESVFFELSDLAAGDELVLSFWKTTDRMFVNNIGYTEFAFQQLGAARALPTWEPPAAAAPGSTESTVGLSNLPVEVRERALSADDNRALKEAFSRYFASHVSSDQSYRYKLTIALAEMHLGTIVSQGSQFAGILYPSVRMFANGDNLGLLPWFVDRHLEFRKAVHVRIKSRTTTKFDIEYLDEAHEFDALGNLAWLGRIRAWTLKPQQEGKFQVVAGSDDDGDYSIARDGTPVHWVAEYCDTGEPILMK